ncbi:MAG: dual specificity protein phosphatase family protein [Candidatus Riflebacteria bacterium]|nr:dual specificity protein phosphatase family protein [Candidatus Riflebacteria bacterium]
MGGALLGGQQPPFEPDDLPPGADLEPASRRLAPEMGAPAAGLAPPASPANQGVQAAVNRPVLDFAWVVPDLLAGGEFPDSEARDWLAGEQFKVLINLTTQSYSDPRFVIHPIVVEDGAAPEHHQIAVFCRIVEESLQKKEKVYVHCLAGCGRTGTMLACYLVWKRKLQWADALDQMRKVRPCSVENEAQEEAIAIWAARQERQG